MKNAAFMSLWSVAYAHSPNLPGDSWTLSSSGLETKYCSTTNDSA